MKATIKTALAVTLAAMTLFATSADAAVDKASWDRARTAAADPARLAEARTLYDALVRDAGAAPDPLLLLERADLLLALGRPDGVAPARARMAALPPQSLDLRTRMALLEAESRLAADDVQAAAPFARQAQALAAQGRDIALRDRAETDLGLVLQSTGDVPGAVKLFEAVLERRKRSERVDLQLVSYGALGSAYLQLGRLKEAWPLIVRSAELAETLPSDVSMRTEALNNAALFATWIGRLDQADRWVALMAADCPPSLRSGCDRGRAPHLASGVAIKRGRLDEAERLARQAVTLRGEDLPPDAMRLADALNGLAVLVAARGDNAAAADMLERAGPAFDKAYGPLSEFSISLKANLVTALVDSGQFDRAQRVVDGVVSGPSAAPADKLGPRFEKAWARLAGRRRDWDTALDLSAKAMARATGDTQAHAQAALVHAEILRHSGRPGAFDAMQKALDLNVATFGPRHREVAPAYQQLGEMKLALGDAEGARALANAARQALPSWLGEGAATDTDAAMIPRTMQMRRDADGLDLDALWALSLRDPARKAERAREAWRVAQRRVAVGGGDAVRASLRRRLAQDGGETAARVQVRERALQSLKTADAALVKVSGDRAATTQARRDALAAADQAETAFRKAENDLAGGSAPFAHALRAEVDEAALRQRLKSDEALLLVTLSEDHADLFVLDAKTLTWIRSPLDTQRLCQSIATLRTSLGLAEPASCGDAPVAAATAPAAPAANERGLAHARPARPYDRRLAYEIWKAVFAPGEAAFKNRPRLVVTVDGPLAGLPLAALVTQSPQGRDDDPSALRRTAWLVRRHATSMLPEPGLLPFLRDAAKTSAAGFAGLGAPCLAACGAQDALSRLAELPYAKPELEALAARIEAPTLVSTGADATTARALSGALGQARVVVFATHALSAGQGGAAEPSLVLSPSAEPSLLSASMIAARLNLKAHVVVLSACYSAAPDKVGGEAYSGLVRAFFVAGAHSALITAAPIMDKEALGITGRFLARDRGGDAAALRAAQLAMIGQPVSTWAPYVLIGDGR